VHDIEIRQKIIDRVLTRRARFHLFDHFKPSETAVVVIDMQPTFVAPGSPAEVSASRGIVQNINTMVEALREKGAVICWVTHANSPVSSGSDWDGFFNNFVAKEVRSKTIESLTPGNPDTLTWHELDTESEDVHLFKNRYSALIQGSSTLERVLRGRGIKNILVAGTKTNVCCEATGRDAMMLDFNTVMVSDCTAALSDEEHQASLETFIQQFGDVLTHTEAIELVGRHANAEEKN
jgi:ureidoacrylate peracid hydrolase